MTLNRHAQQVKLDTSGLIGMVTDDDPERSVITELLGREPLGAFSVAVRDENGTPRVIKNFPVLGSGRPMPTLYWLVSREDRLLVSRLESDGGVREADQQIDPGAIAKAHDDYAIERDTLLGQNYDGHRPSGGVGGTRRGVKCLHAHYAYYLAGGDDPVGRWVQERLDQLTAESLSDHEQHCPDQCCGRVGQGETTSQAQASPDVVAAIDCGSQSTRLLIATKDLALHRDLITTKLSEGLAETGRISLEAQQRFETALETYLEICKRYGVDQIVAIATAAARRASNGAEVLASASEILGTQIEVIDGQTEAELSFQGASSALIGSESSEAVATKPETLVVFDIGGASTEIAVGTASANENCAQLVATASLPIGSVTLSQTHLKSDPPTSDELQNAIEAAVAQLRTLEQSGAASDPDFVFDSEKTLVVGCAGTVATVVSITLGLQTYSRERIHHHVITLEALEAVLTRLSELDVGQRTNVVGLDEGRVESIIGGVCILKAIMTYFDIEKITASEDDILDALAANSLSAPQHQAKHTPR